MSESSVKTTLFKFAHDGEQIIQILKVQQMVKDVELMYYQKVLQEIEQAILSAQQQFIQNASRTSIGH